MFCTIFALLSVAKVLEKHVRNSSYLELVFFKENSHSRRKFTERLFLLLVGYRKVNKIYQWILKLGDRLWALEITHWKWRLYGELFCIRQTLQLWQFYRMSLAALWALLVNIFEKLPLINSEVNLRPPQHLK